jgi:hypothetical protein
MAGEPRRPGDPSRRVSLVVATVLAGLIEDVA